MREERDGREVRRGRKGRDELPRAWRRRRERGLSEKRSCALLSPKRSYFFISFGDPVEEAAPVGCCCAPQDFCVPSSTVCARTQDVFPLGT